MKALFPVFTRPREDLKRELKDPLRDLVPGRHVFVRISKEN
jgi:hypothetical protein